MSAIIKTWLLEQGIGVNYIGLTSTSLGGILILILCSVSYYIAKHQVLTVIHKVITASKNTWDDLLYSHNVFSRIALLMPLLVLLLITPMFLSVDSIAASLLITLAKIAICFQVVRSISAILNVINSAYQQTASERYLPLNSTLQVVKLAIYLVAAILAISFILGRSPFYLLSGLGALTAVLLLIFQDTIKGLVASIQISANKMVAPGDWIELPNYGADGDVLEIGLNTVKVKNFDKTITTVPTYALTTGSFKNWHAMFASGGRRIKRAIVIDISTIHFYNDEEIATLKSIELITDYLTNKQQEITTMSTQQQRSTGGLNVRKLTNIGTYRAYINAYLRQHKNVHQDMTCMVRQLAATEVGLPLELYFFSNDQNWVNYEMIQADIFDHLFAAAPLFDLKIFQHLSALELRQPS